MLQIKYKGPIYNCSGYAKLKFLFLKLSEFGHKIKILPMGTHDNRVEFLYDDRLRKLENTNIESSYIYITSGIGPQLRPDNEAAYNIAYSMFETSVIPERWIPFYNEFDEIWTPSTFCAKSFNIRDIDAQVRVIPFGVDETLFNRAIKSEEYFTFLAVGQWVDRKGWDLLINAYTSEFVGVNDVRLCIKTNEPYKTKEELIKEYLTTDKTSYMPRIMVNNSNVDEGTLPLFYNEANCFVLPSRGEAFGIPFLEAMSSGVPCIASDFGGQLDFIDEDVGWLIPINSLKHLSERLCKINAGYKKLWFAEPEIKDIRKIMRYVYENKDEVKEKGKKSRQFVTRNLTWDKVSKLVEKRLKEISGVLI